MLYSETVMDHFRHPRNVGIIENADGVGEVGNAKCGDIMKIYLKIDDGQVTDVKFETFGCGSAIASSSMATEMIKGQPVSRLLSLTNKAVVEALDGLPPPQAPLLRPGRGGSQSRPEGLLRPQRHPLRPPKPPHHQLRKLPLRQENPPDTDPFLYPAGLIFFPIYASRVPYKSVLLPCKIGICPRYSSSFSKGTSCTSTPSFSSNCPRISPQGPHSRECPYAT